MSAEENELARAVREFNATVDALMRPGVSWIAELAQLKALISKYPQPAAQILSEQCPAGSISEPPTRHEVDRPCQPTSVRPIQRHAKNPPVRRTDRSAMQT
jgi:hypothetical protein